MFESSSPPWQTSGSRLHEEEHDNSLNDGDLTDDLDLAFDGAEDGPGQSHGSGGMPPLPAQWPTPAAQNWKGSSEASVIRADGKSRMDILHYRAEQGFTHPDPVITSHG